MDSDTHYIPRSGTMFARSSPAKAQMATDLAIPILADGGWQALTLRNVAAAANVTPQAIAAWFPSVAAMRAAVAAVYGDRWIRERDNLARARTFSRDRAYTSSDVAEALLPQSWVEDVYDGIWVTIVEAGRWDETVGAAVVAVQDRERDLVRRLLEPSWPDGVERLEREVDLVLATVRGLRATHVPSRSGTTSARAGSVLAGLGGAS